MNRMRIFKTNINQATYDWIIGLRLWFENISVSGFSIRIRGLICKGLLNLHLAKHFLIRLDFKCASAPMNQQPRASDPTEAHAQSGFTKLDASKNVVSVSREQTFSVILSQSRSRTNIETLAPNPKKLILIFYYENVTY